MRDSKSIKAPPCSLEAAACSDLPDSAPTHAGKDSTASILLVDDRKDKHLVFNTILQDLGQNLVNVSSGKEALRCLLREDFAVILLDVNMPGMDGFETAALIRQRKKSEDTPIIFLTAYGAHETKIAQAYSLGAVDYIHTPIVPEILRAKVSVFVDLFRKALALKRIQSELEQRVHHRTAELEKMNIALQDEVRERIKVEDTLRQRAGELVQTNQELEQFAYVASHDLQEPLRMVTNYMQLLEKKHACNLGSEERKYIAYAVEGAKRMQSMIKDLLTYSRVGRTNEPLAELDCGAALNTAMLNLSQSIQESKAQIQAGTLPMVRANPWQLVQVLQNLVGNAIKFNRTEHPRVEIASLRREKEWVISVSDNGIGIDPAYHEKIFHIFHRLNRREEYTGTGVGLTIARKIVEQHGGRIWVESALGQGATFFFTLPAP